MHLVKVIRLSNGQSLVGVEPYVVGRYSRVKLGRGETRAQRNSYGELLLRKFEEPYYVLNYYEYQDYYIFIIEDTRTGVIEHEIHVFLETEA